jgi:tripartite motif-containing protein 71
MKKVHSKQLFSILAAFYYVVTMLLPATAVAEEAYKFERMWPTLKQPWYFNYPEGIATDAMGYVYVADTYNQRIQKFTSEGVFVKAWGSPDSGKGEFWYPNAIAIDVQGYVYVTDGNNYRIRKFTSDGLFVKAWGNYGSGNGELDNPRGIATDAMGYVYVADTYNHRIQKFTSDGLFVKAWDNSNPVNGVSFYPVDIATDTKGYVYVSGYNKMALPGLLYRKLVI